MQPPQWLKSLEVSTQLGPHHEYGPGQSQTPVPASPRMQEPEVQTLPQRPQLEGSKRLVQDPLQQFALFSPPHPSQPWFEMPQPSGFVERSTQTRPPSMSHATTVGEGLQRHSPTTQS